MKTKGSSITSFKVLGEENCQLQILYPAKVSFRDEWQIDILRQRELKECVTNRFAFNQQMNTKQGILIFSREHSKLTSNFRVYNVTWEK